MRLPRFLLNLFVVVMVLFLILPIVLVVLTSFTGGDFIKFPPDSLSLKHYVAAVKDTRFVDAFWVSVGTAFVSSTLAILLGAPAAIGLARYSFPGRDAIQSFLLSPLMIPGLVMGITLLQFYSALHVRPSTITIVAGHLIITLPYAVRLLTASLMGFDRRIELAAMSLGASPQKAFTGVTLPNISAGFLAAFAFAAIMSFDDVGLSLFIAPARGQTLPVAIFTYLDQTYDPKIIAVSSVMILISTVAVLVLDRMVGLSRILMNAQSR